MAYLLGELSEKERARLEEEYFADDALFEEIRVAETELIDSYVRRRLSDTERSRFEARYLAFPELRKRVDLARVLAEKADSAGTPIGGRSVRWWQWSPEGRWWPRPAMVAAMAAVALLVVVVGAWWLAKTPTRPETTTARLEAPTNPVVEPPDTLAQPLPSTQAPPGTSAPTKPLSDAATGGGFALVIASSLVRSSGTEPVLTIPTGVETVRIRIDYGGEIYATYGVEISTPEGRKVWSQSGLKPLVPGAASVAITVPTKDLAPGNYILTLSAGAAGQPLENIAEYGFLVTRK